MVKQYRRIAVPFAWVSDAGHYSDSQPFEKKGDQADRPNIKLSVLSFNSTQHESITFSWLEDILETEGENCPSILIFCKSFSDCGKIYFILNTELSRL